MARSNGTMSTPRKLVVTQAPNHSTLQWHPAIAPRPLPQSPCNGTQQWHHAHYPPTIAQWHLKFVVTLPPNHSTLQLHPTMAPSNGATSTAPCNGTLVLCPIRQSGSSPSLPIGRQNPYTIAICGNIKTNEKQQPKYLFQILCLDPWVLE